MEVETEGKSEHTSYTENEKVSYLFIGSPFYIFQKKTKKDPFKSFYCLLLPIISINLLYFN